MFDGGEFILDINPSVAVSYDEDGNVTEAEGLNEDGKVLLYGLELNGKSYAAAAELLFGRCVELGYFSPGRSDNALLASATKKDGSADEKMTAAMKKAFLSAFSKRKINGVVITGVSDPALDAAAQAYGIDGQKYALIQEYLSMGGTLAETEYATVTVRELYASIGDLEEKGKKDKIEQLKADQGRVSSSLCDALADALEEVIDGLEDCIDKVLGEGADDGHTKTYYEAKIEEIEEYAEGIEDVRHGGEAQALVEKILSALETLKTELGAGVLSEKITAAQTMVSAIFEEFEGIMSEMTALNRTTEEIFEERLSKFADADDEEDEDFDEGWQNNKENEVAGSWYENKKHWNDERKEDLKESRPSEGSGKGEHKPEPNPDGLGGKK